MVVKMDYEFTKFKLISDCIFNWKYFKYHA